MFNIKQESIIFSCCLIFCKKNKFKNGFPALFVISFVRENL